MEMVVGRRERTKLLEMEGRVEERRTLLAMEEEVPGERRRERTVELEEFGLLSSPGSPPSLRPFSSTSSSSRRKLPTPSTPSSTSSSSSSDSEFSSYSTTSFDDASSLDFETTFLPPPTPPQLPRPPHLLEPNTSSSLHAFSSSDSSSPSRRSSQELPLPRPFNPSRSTSCSSTSPHRRPSLTGRISNRSSRTNNPRRRHPPSSSSSSSNPHPHPPTPPTIIIISSSPSLLTTTVPPLLVPSPPNRWTRTTAGN
ncbi:hypothetical protein BDY24DRAFT_377935 [Mrakia frigida]|uniref:uncharacterized protein n=1 Tax=Mrakia frigida TaxID=29902 RepID=UPI003FCBF71C